MLFRFHAIKIAEVYPDICIISIHDEDKNKYDASVCEISSKGEIVDTLYTFGLYLFDSPEEAVFAMQKRVRIYLDSVKTMSN